MFGQQKGHLFALVEVFHNLEHFFHNLWCQAHGRLVQQHHTRVGHEGTANRTHLLLTTRGVRGLRATPGLQARKVGIHLFQVARHLSLVFARVAARQQILLDRQVRKTMAAFHDLHHTALHQVGRSQVFNPVAAQFNRAFGHRPAFSLEQVGDGAQRGGFPRSVAPQHRHNLAFGHVQRHPFEHQDHVVVDDFNAIDVKNDVWSAHN